MVLDDGGDATRILHDRYPDLLAGIRGTLPFLHGCFGLICGHGVSRTRPSDLSQVLLVSAPFFDGVDAVAVKGKIILDRHDGSVWGLITPHSIDRTLAAERNAEVAAIPLVRAVRGAIGAVEEPHVDVLARNVLDGGIGRFAERQGFSCVGDDPPRDRHHDPSGIAFNRDRMIRAGNFDRLRWVPMCCSMA